MHVNEGLMLGHMRLMFDLISTPFQSPSIPLFLNPLFLNPPFFLDPPFLKVPCVYWAWVSF